MDLWIRSQARNSLRKVTGLNMTEGTLPYRYYIEEYDTDTLGEYTSKRRALEVLDEIQKIIDGDYTYYDVKDNTIKNCNKVYEMPKE